MKVQGLNNSSRKTRMLIKNTFAELLKEKKSIEKITVSELVRRAGITRSAFYTHFDNIYDLAENFQSEVIDLIMIDKELYSFEDVSLFLDEIVKFLKENEEIYKNILSADAPLVFLSSLNKLLNEKLVKTLEMNNSKNKLLDVYFFTDAVISLFIKYFREELDISLDDLNVYIKDKAKKIFFN